MSKTPKLRFKEFSGDWEKKKLGTVASLVKDGTHGTHADVQNGPYLLSAKNIQDGKIIITDEDRKISYEDYNSIYRNYSLEENDILLSIVGTIGRSAVMSNIKDIAFQRSVAILRFNLDSKYIYQYMNTTIFQNQLLRKQVVSAQPGIYLNDLKKLDMSIPSKEEQEKIASFFSLIDDKISLQSEKLDMLKDYKKGMMQKIFSRELRFKDDEGRDYPEWEEKKLKYILKEVNEKTKINNQYEVISSTTNGLYLQKEYFNREIASSDNTGYKILRMNQVVLSPQNLWMGNINMNNKYDIGIVSPSYKIFDIDENFDSKYIGYILRTPRAFYEFMQSSEQGASIVRRNLNMDLFNEISFELPSKEEQIKISEFISTIDTKIQKEQEKLDSLNEYKKGLLQQMFV